MNAPHAKLYVTVNGEEPPHAHPLSLPTWDEYQQAEPDRQRDIRVRWCAIGHGYRGDGSQRDEAYRLYTRAQSEIHGHVCARQRLGEDSYDGDGGRELAEHMLDNGRGL